MTKTARAVLIAASMLAFCAALLRPSGPAAAAEPIGPRPAPTAEAAAPAPSGLAAASVGAANLVVEGIEIVPSGTLLVGRSATIRVTVGNRGTAAPGNAPGEPASFWLDIFVDPPVSSAEDILRMPSYPPTVSQGVQSHWLPAGGSAVIEFGYAFESTGRHDVYAVADIAELGLPYGNVYEGGSGGETDNAFGPHSVQVAQANVLTTKDNADFTRGPASSLALVPVAADQVGQAGQGSLVIGDTALSLGYFEEPPKQWGFTDPITPDYSIETLDNRLNDDTADRPQEWLRLAATNEILIAVWQDGRNSQLVDYDIYMTYSVDQGATWAGANIRANTDAVGEGDQRRPAVAVSPVSGRALVVWQDRVELSDPTTRYVIKGQWYMVAAGFLTPLGGNFDISASSEVNSVSPDVAAGPEGNFYVVWQDDQAGNNDIWLRGWSATNTNWMSQPRRISDDPEDSNQRAPRVTAGRSDVLQDYTFGDCLAASFSYTIVKVDPVIVVWEDDRNTDTDVYGTYSIDGAQTFAVDFRINDDDVSDGVSQRQASVAVAQAWDQRHLCDDRTEGCVDPDTGAQACVDVKVPTAAFYYVWQDFRNSTNGAKNDNPDIFMLRTAATAGVDTRLQLAGEANERISATESTPVWQEYPDVVTRSYATEGEGNVQERHNAFFVWADRSNTGSENSDIYMAVRGDAGRSLPASFVDGVVQVNSGSHATNLSGSTYLSYDPGDPPSAHQTRPAIAADIMRRLSVPFAADTWEHSGFVYVGWDDSRHGGYDRDVYLTRSNLSYFANYDFYRYPTNPQQIAVGPEGTYCRYGSGSYVSPIYDMVMEDVAWDRIEWNAVTPSGTFLTLQTRVGDDADNLGEWMPKSFPYALIGLPELGAPLQGYDTPGQQIVGANGLTRPVGRYVQYRVNMWSWPEKGPVANTCGDPGDPIPVVYDPVAATPMLYSVSLHYVGGLRTSLLPAILGRYRGR